MISLRLVLCPMGRPDFQHISKFQSKNTAVPTQSDLLQEVIKKKRTHAIRNQKGERTLVVLLV